MYGWTFVFLELVATDLNSSGGRVFALMTETKILLMLLKYKKVQLNLISYTSVIASEIMVRFLGVSLQ